MGYDIYIGEAEIDVPSAHDVQEYGDNGLDVEVRSMMRDDAPEFPGDDMTGKGNSRHPSYSGWTNFCERVGLHGLFFDKETGLMRQHPGCCLLTRKAHDEIKAALDRYRETVPGKVPGWDPTLQGMAAVTGEGADPKYDGDLARIMWLEWWVRWALENCKIPAVYNH